MVVGAAHGRDRAHGALLQGLFAPTGRSYKGFSRPWAAPTEVFLAGFELIRVQIVAGQQLVKVGAIAFR